MLTERDIYLWRKKYNRTFDMWGEEAVYLLNDHWGQYDGAFRNHQVTNSNSNSIFNLLESPELETPTSLFPW